MSNTLRTYVVEPSFQYPNEIMEKQYELWSSVWSRTYSEVLGAEYKYTSDDFTRQEYCLSIHNQQDCLGLVLYRGVNVNHSSTETDSYFGVWSDREFKQLKSRANRVLVCSSFTINPKYKMKIGRVPTMHLLTAQAIEFLNHSDYDLMVGTMRRDVGVHKLMYRFGASLLTENVSFGNVSADLVTFEKENMKYPNARIEEVSRTMWAEHSTLTEGTVAAAA